MQRGSSQVLTFEILKFVLPLISSRQYLKL